MQAAPAQHRTRTGDRHRVSGTGRVGDERIELAVGPRRIERSEAPIQFVWGESPLGGRMPQSLGQLLPVGVRSA